MDRADTMKNGHLVLDRDRPAANSIVAADENTGPRLIVRSTLHPAAA